MLPRWRRIRLIVTIFFTIMAAGLMFLAYALLGRFPGVTVVTLAMIAVLLPVGFYLLATVVGWQRSEGSDARPNALVGWIIRNRIAPVLPILFMFLLLGLGRGMDLTPIDREARNSADLSRSMHASCVDGARKEIARAGSDPDSVDMKAKALAYCSCVTVTLQREYTADEFVRLASDPGGLDKDEKVNRIIDSCAKAASG
jgi:hypothetical protein